MIAELRLEQFRNYEQRHFSFGPGTTILTGPNGAGKTSVLEAISMLSLTTSWKTEKDTEVIRWGQPFARVTSGSEELVVQASPYLKRIRWDGVSRRAVDVIGRFPTVLFQPDDLFLLYGAPAFRRQYLDRIISQTSPTYTRAALQLVKVLKQRNRLLKNIQEGAASLGELSFWDNELAQLQEVMQAERQALVGELNRLVPPLFADMVAGPPIALKYQTSPHGHTHSFLEHLQLNREKEVAAGSSLYGPHREDVEVSWGGHPAQEAMSRGQARALLVSFKIAELEYISASNEVRPVLLLDDIFSELDSERRHRLVGVFGDYQVIMTTTELGALEGLLPSQAEVLEVAG